MMTLATSSSGKRRSGDPSSARQIICPSRQVRLARGLSTLMMLNDIGKMRRIKHQDALNYNFHKVFSKYFFGKVRVYDNNGEHTRPACCFSRRAENLKRSGAAAY